MAQFIISIAALKRNTAILQQLGADAGCRVVIALKGFSCWKTFPYLRDHLDGCCASGLWEARLANEEFGKTTITYSPAYTHQEVDSLLEFTTHLDFNSLSQWFRFKETIIAHPRFQNGEVKCGLRINPEHSTGQTPIYDPCIRGSRLGITASDLKDADLTGISGLHFHTLCEQGAEDLESTLTAVDQRFGQLLHSPQITHLNMGGGHWITKPDYNRELLVQLIRRTSDKYQLEVWLEPGEASAIHTGVLRSTVLDVFESNGHRHAILDVSATAHMPDVLEMPYRPDVYLARAPDKSVQAKHKPSVVLDQEVYQPAGNPAANTDLRVPPSAFVHRLGGMTCLAGDVIGDYSFPRRLKTGDTLVFDDMAHYTMVKTTTFNGVPHPDIVLQLEDGKLETIRQFTYEDFRDRLA